MQGGDLPVAIVIPAGLGAAFATAALPAAGRPIQLLADVSDPIAPQMVYGLLQKVTMTAAPDLLMQGGLRQFEKYAGRVDAAAARRRRCVAAAAAASRPAARRTDGAGTGGAMPMGVGVETVDVMRTDKRARIADLVLRGRHRRDVPAVLVVGGAGGTLLDEVESGTLERLLSTQHRHDRRCSRASGCCSRSIGFCNCA